MDTSESGKERYMLMIKKTSPPSRVVRNCLRAFLVGGGICAVGQVFKDAMVVLGLSGDDASLAAACLLVVISVLLTSAGLYSKLGRIAGAGSIVPITGFANAVTAPAIEYKKEGLILGVGAKMFVIAGPVIVYGAMTSVLVGLFYYFLG